ncbi:Outer membrane protein OmpA [Bizionia echini]|uniref:Outer membrane protein OmpA n=1 Tax=Bizionia echini TaxID=649333 RepID=A0A1I4YYD7_9FLAO|nr:OmpA family protein [Bizionia echini]SFN43034.1 Outer membrane protein OmpA [Bizionia echini]
MKNIKIFIALIVMSSLSATAQNKATESADKHFAKYEFVEAIEDYNKLVENGKADTYVYAQLGEANYNIFNTVESERWYAKALETSEDAEMVYKYSQMLKANEKYQEANAQMERFAQLKPRDDRAKAFKSNPDYLPSILDKAKEYTIQNLEINTENSDFGGAVYNSQLYFTTARNNARRNYGWNDQPFLDVYVSNILTDGTYQEADPVRGDINTKYHEGTVAFSPDGNTMYFSRESYFDGEFEKDSLSNTKFSIIHLYKATKEGDKWRNVEALSLNNSNYSVNSPALSADGKTLYFHSNMPGGFGLFDLYKAPVNDDGTVGEPVNLGDKVNTEGNEKFPFSSSNGTLYFSSDGHLGLGGLDVFYMSETGDIVNAGVPVNSNVDDFAFTVNEETGEGFVSSNRSGGKGGDDIYALKRLVPCNVNVITTVVDNDTNNPLAGVAVKITDASGRVLLSQTTDANGQVEYTVSCDKSLEISGVLEDYASNTLSFAGSKEKEVLLQLNLDPLDKIIVLDRVVLNPILFDFDKSNITQQGAFELDKLVSVMQKYPNMVILAESHTDNRGPASYNERLSDRRAKSTVQYVISKGIDASRISGVGKGENEPKIDCKSKCTEAEHQTNRRSEFIIVSGNPAGE